MYYLPTSCLIFFFFFLFSLFHPLSCSSSRVELCDEALFRCGNITAGFPFWGGKRHKHCGHPFLKLQCNMDSTSIFMSDQEFIVLHLNQTSNTLTLARTDHHLGSFCSFNFTNITLPPEFFELSSTYKSLTVFYHCEPSLSHLWSDKCPEIGHTSVSEYPYHHNTCPSKFTLNLPSNFFLEEKESSLAHLESALQEGFDVNVKIDVNACRKCLSSHERCVFIESLTSGFTCDQPPTDTLFIDLNQVMYYLPTSCLLFFVLFSLFHHLSCAPSKKEPGWCEALFECGNITAGFPFSGGNRPQFCGHPSLELHCYKNTTSMIISNHLYDVLHIDPKSKTLRLDRSELRVSFCNATFTAATLPPDIFELSPTYKSLTVFYLCNPKLPYHSSYTCPGRGLISVSQTLDYHNSCDDSFTINVPKSFVPEEKELNITNLESALREGFDVKLKIDEKACQGCLSSNGTCGFDSTQVCCKNASSSVCSRVHPTDADEHHRRCSQPFSCGNQNDLSYPFWITGRDECGHPEYKLECNTNSGFPEVSISSVKFTILQANYPTSRIIKLARSEYITDVCPQNPLTEPFNENVLRLVSGTELLTIYYDCQEFRTSTYVGELTCDDGRSYYVTRSLSSPLLGGMRDLLNGFSGSCERNVSIPASGPALNTLQSNPSQDNFRKALREGFEVGQNRECLRCMDSGGACGYNQTVILSEFVCYCIDGPHKHTCRSTNRLSTGLIIGIVAACGLAVILVAVGLFCLIRRRRKTQSDQCTSKDLPVTSYSSREASSFPTSTTYSSSNHSLLASISNVANGSTYFGVQVFSYEELEEATENFSRELGDGGFGTVYYGLLKDGRAVAVKRLYERSLKRVEQFKNEIEILKSLKHPNLVILYGCTSRHSRELLLVYEYISNGTLADHLHGDRAESRPLCWPVRLNVAIETASALTFLHKSGIIHRDVKTTNILLDENHTVKVADFGLSRLFPTDQTHISTAPQGTPGYVDPEYYQCYRLNEKSDVYSFGVVLTELISSKEAVDITRHRHDINLANMAVSKIQNNALHELVDPSLGFEMDPEVRKRMMAVAELAFRCLQQEREVRPSMDEIVEILKGIKGEKRDSAPDVVDIEGSGGDDVGLLRHSVPPPISPETDKWTSSSDTAASSF
ncbi:unnamed protein product [Thlaspi arvense]|uniref:non-specific serine/threonine protein kinase n=1 Tax=Thlaspi arvense TaxID=13288 RepID=A0AAU9SJ48_THLAR|nr:unnamed protein product [Thlaspi arvense]